MSTKSRARIRFPWILRLNSQIVCVLFFVFLVVEADYIAVGALINVKNARKSSNQVAKVDQNQGNA